MLIECVIKALKDQALMIKKLLEHGTNKTYKRLNWLSLQLKKW